MTTDQSRKPHVSKRVSFKAAFPILSDLEAAVSRLDRLGLAESEIAEKMDVSLKTVQRRIRSAAGKRQVIARIIRMAHMGKGADEVIECLGGCNDRRERQTTRTARKQPCQHELTR